MQLVQLAGIRVDSMSSEGACEKVLHTSRHTPVKVFFANAHCVNVAQKDPGYLEAMRRADFVLNDGIGMEIAGRLMRQPFEENLNGTDWIPAFLDCLAGDSQSWRRVFLLGTEDPVLNRAEIVFNRRWPQLEIVGFHHGYYEDPSEVILEIRAARPEVLIVAMGVPRQEVFLQDHWEELKQSGVKVAIAGGAILDFLTLKVPRAPKWLRSLRLEWIYRLWIEPRRMWRRYLFGNAKFLSLVFREWFGILGLNQKSRR